MRCITALALFSGMPLLHPPLPIPDGPPAKSNLDLGTANGLSISIVVNGEDPIVFEGDTALDGSYLDPAGRWSITWNFDVDDDPSEPGSMIGAATFKNTSGDDAVFDMILDAPVCPVVFQQSLLGASLILKLIANDDGATVESAGQTPIFAALADTEVGGVIFSAPFQLSGGGGIMSTSGSFGSPFPNLPGPPIQEAAGLRLCFSMSDGDTAEFDSSFYFSADGDNLGNCPGNGPIGDLNGDGSVNVHDLTLLFASWGPCSGCDADLNGDGVVNVADVIILLENWGS